MCLYCVLSHLWIVTSQNVHPSSVTALNKALNVESAGNGLCFGGNCSNSCSDAKLQSNTAAGDVSHTGASGFAGAAQGRLRRIHGRTHPPKPLHPSIDSGYTNFVFGFSASRPLFSSHLPSAAQESVSLDEPSPAFIGPNGTIS